MEVEERLEHVEHLRHLREDQRSVRLIFHPPKQNVQRLQLTCIPAHTVSAPDITTLFCSINQFVITIFYQGKGKGI